MRNLSSLVWQVLTKEQQELAAKNEYNFDHPDAFDFELLVTVLRKLKKGKSIKVPVYDFTSHCRRKEWVSMLFVDVFKQTEANKLIRKGMIQLCLCVCCQNGSLRRFVFCNLWS